MALIIDMVHAAITPDLVRGASRTIGEDPSAVQHTLNVAVPTVLAGALRQGSTQAGAEQLRSMITDPQYAGEGPGGFSRLLESADTADAPLRAGERAVSNLFGDKTDRISDAVARTAGVQRSSAATLLSMVTPLVLSVLHRQVASRNLDAHGLMDLLSTERDSIMRGLPPGVATELGLGEAVPITGRTQAEERAERAERATVRGEAEHRYEKRAHPTGPRRPSMRPLLIGGLAGLALLFFLTRNRDRDREIVVEAPPAAEMPATPPAAPPSAPPVTTPEQPATAQPAAPVSQLSSFLSNGTAGSTPRSFLLDGVQFQNGSAELSAASRSAIGRVADVLTAHPNARIRIEAFTDSRGDAAANRTLSVQRADAVKQALVAGGVAANRITTEGLGAERPATAEDTEAGRARNNRVELVVLQR
jgi:outer membrane protein OmpA-like peptidoglycan-associated protein